jgi:hypothetical protein
MDGGQVHLLGVGAGVGGIDPDAVVGMKEKEVFPLQSAVFFTGELEGVFG